jgi:hypothetical protein
MHIIVLQQSTICHYLSEEKKLGYDFFIDPAIFCSSGCDDDIDYNNIGPWFHLSSPAQRRCFGTDPSIDIKLAFVENETSVRRKKDLSRFRTRSGANPTTFKFTTTTPAWQ